MSRTNPNQQGTPNPAKRFFEWKGGVGKFQYYDKDEKKNIDLPDNFTFILLDELNCIKGYNENLKAGIYSNEVRNLSQQKLFVSYFKGDKIAEGFYNDIKDKITSKSVGGKFSKSVYIAFKDENGKLQIGNIQFSGSGVDGWFAFTSKHKNDIYKGAIQLTGKTAEKKGATSYFVPTFGLKEISAQADAEAELLQIELSAYLKEYFERAGHVEFVDRPHENDMPPDTLFVDESVVTKLKEEVAEEKKSEEKDRLAINEDGHLGEVDSLPF